MPHVGYTPMDLKHQAHADEEPEAADDDLELSGIGESSFSPMLLKNDSDTDFESPTPRTVGPKRYSMVKRALYGSFAVALVCGAVYATGVFRPAPPQKTKSKQPVQLQAVIVAPPAAPVSPCATVPPVPPASPCSTVAPVVATTTAAPISPCGTVAPPAPTTTTKPPGPTTTTKRPESPGCHEPDAAVINMTTAKLLRNNLGGKGPDNSVDQVLYYEEAATFRNFKADLRIDVAPGSTYTPFVEKGSAVKYNGKSGNLGSIQIQTGTSVTLKFELFGSKGHPAVPTMSYFSFFDVDTGPNGEGAESITLQGATMFFAQYPDTEITKTTNGDKTETFTGTGVNVKDDTPQDPLKLTPLQAKRTVTFFFNGTEPFTATLKATPTTPPRAAVFYFGGGSSIAPFCYKKK